MPWPDDYIDWGGRGRDDLRQQVESALNSLLSPNPLPDEEIKELVDLAVLEAFNLAYGHQRDPEYFQDESQFRLWLCVVAVREAVRLLLRHDRVEPRLHQLPTDQYRLLGMVYLDRLIYGDVAAVLHMSSDEVRRRCYEALQALCQLLAPNVCFSGSAGCNTVQVDQKTLEKARANAMPGWTPAQRRGKTGISGLVNAFRMACCVAPRISRAFCASEPGRYLRAPKTNVWC